MVAFLEQVSRFITGPFGIALIIIAVASSFLASMPPFRAVPPASGFVALFFGALAFAAGWAVRTFISISA